uniref:Major facilitator superfamily (MFS) profile domain-containing protein n=1 Tax=Denticeps clupeoides TaxID=299321 RepID=A0A8C4A730_9TELE
MESDGLIPSQAEPSPDLPKLLHFKVYRRRWFVLALLCLLNSSNATLWLTFAPVADETMKTLGVSLYQVNWLSMVYMVVAIPVSCGTTWMIDKWGLRITLVLGSWLNMIGSIVRMTGALATVPDWLRFPLVLVGQTVCSLAQPLVIFSPTKLAALWFPEHQRAMANMAASMSNPLGVLLANIVSPVIISSTSSFVMLLFIYSIPPTIICFLATVGLRQSVPPTPPSASAENSSSEPFVQSIKLLLKNRSYLILLLCFGLGVAVFTCFTSLLEQILCVKGYNNAFAGQCGVLFILLGLLGAGATSWYVDQSKKFSETTKISICLASVACSIFAVVSQMPDQKTSVAVTCCLFGLFGFAMYPVAMELSVECSYPVGEATSAGIIFIAGQILSMVCMFLLQLLARPLSSAPLSVCAVSDETLSWRVPVLVMAGLWCLAACVFVIFFNTDYRRLQAEQAATEHTPVLSGL